MARRESLLEFFEDRARNEGPFLVYDDGYRTWTHTYVEVATASRAVALRLRQSGIQPGEKVILYSINRPEWVAAFWGILLAGAVVVPVDFRFSEDLLASIARKADAKLIIAGQPLAGSHSPTVWNLGPWIWEPTSASAAPPPPTSGNAVAQILFTSGATADPKGVLITHRNILANLEPVESEIGKYRRYSRPFFPIRFLNLLPLSHMFGQVMATFIPPLLPGVTIFSRVLDPSAILKQIHTHRVSVVVCVPRMLDLLRQYVVRQFPEAAVEAPKGTHWLKRWWRYRRVHRAFGWKFWSFVVGAAPLDPALEEFWAGLGFVVIQGYGLTETAPIVTLNHPFRQRKGTVGKPISGVEVKIAPDGEILVRGENVTPGYYGGPDQPDALREGWLETGDIGAFDPSGNLIIQGRKKEMIVTPEGINVFPEDIEKVLNGIEGVRESAIVADRSGVSEAVHAVLVLDPGVDRNDVVARANRQLEQHQQIRRSSQWPAQELPKTEGTGKLKRGEIRSWLQHQDQPMAREGTSALASVVARFSPDESLLGLSSLDRVEMMTALEQRFQAVIPEESFQSASTVADLERLIANPPAADKPADDVTAWPWVQPARLLRNVSLPLFLLPLARIFMRLQVKGLENLPATPSPCVFAANHQSHLDGPAILSALPARFRYRIAPAMAEEFFAAVKPAQRLNKNLLFILASLFFGAFPIAKGGQGTRQTMRQAGRLVDQGLSVLIFPEGKMTEQGELNPLQPGAALLAGKLNIPLIPVGLEGLHQVLHKSWKWPSRGRVQVQFGRPIEASGRTPSELTSELETAWKKMRGKP